MSEAGQDKAPKSKKALKKEAKSAGTNVAVGEQQTDKNYVPRFKKRYNETIKPELMKKFGYTNVMQVPKINKIVLNIGAGEGAARSRLPRTERQELRRPRQLRHGPEGTHRLRRNRLRQDGNRLGHGHHHQHVCEDRRRSQRASQGLP